MFIASAVPSKFTKLRRTWDFEISHRGWCRTKSLVVEHAAPTELVMRADGVAINMTLLRSLR